MDSSRQKTILLRCNENIVQPGLACHDLHYQNSNAPQPFINVADMDNEGHSYNPIPLHREGLNSLNVCKISLLRQ